METEEGLWCGFVDIQKGTREKRNKALCNI